MADQIDDDQAFEMPLPAADFSFLVSSLMFQAQVDMGLLQFGEGEDQPQPNLSRAKHSLDLLGVLDEKTRGNLSVEEQRLLENGLTELRFRYVQVLDELKKNPRPQTSTSQTGNEPPLIITPGGGKGTKSD
ncbi:MAG TPA: DUF1844 domain-containing protein [Bryobacteraceae bacterium]|nr:DUF1844 domain-containing protein [Bryobacteraceae bacterium]